MLRSAAGICGSCRIPLLWAGAQGRDSRGRTFHLLEASTGVHFCRYLNHEQLKTHGKQLSKTTVSKRKSGTFSHKEFKEL